MCELLRWLAVGKITNDEFEADLPESYDRSIVEIFSKGAWFLYDDLREYKLSGRDSLESYEKSIVARWILFLKTDFEYEWPNAEFREAFIKTISLGLFGQSTLDKWRKYGDVSYWPFKNGDQFEYAKKTKVYLQ